MPVSKKPRAKKAADKAWPRPGAADAAALPDRRTMERFLAALGGSRGGGNDPTEKAQDLMYDAWERTTARSRIALARKALGISPLCADAYVLLAEEAAGSLEEARDLYAKGVEAGELALEGLGVEAEGQRLLDDVDLRVRPGRKVAVVGEVGAGKSVLVDVVTGLRRATDGDVRLGEHALARLPAGLGGVVAPVPQDPVILADTVRTNVLLGRDIDEEALARAVRVSQL